MSNSVWPHRRQPTRLPRPWDSAGKNTGVGCHFLLHSLSKTTKIWAKQLKPTISELWELSKEQNKTHLPRTNYWGLWHFKLWQFTSPLSPQLSVAVAKTQHCDNGEKTLLSSLLSNCGAREDSRVHWTARGSNQSVLEEINPEYSLEGLMLKLQYFGHLMQRADSLGKTLMLGGLKAKGEGGNRGWDG